MQEKIGYPIYKNLRFKASYMSLIGTSIQKLFGGYYDKKW
jgi:hypothetical protein